MTETLSKEKNYIRQIINKNAPPEGLYKEDYRLFDEIEKKLQEKSKINEQGQGNIYHFKPVSSNVQMVADKPVKYAAQSETSRRRKPEFYYNDEKNIALKITVKNQNQVSAVIIAEANVDVRKTIIFCREIGKYLISDGKGEFIIGYFDDFDLNKFNFDFLFPAEEIVILKFGDDYIPSAKGKRAAAGQLIINDDFIDLKVVTTFDVNAVVFKSGSHIDFAKNEDGSVMIPRVFLSPRMKVYIY